MTNLTHRSHKRSPSGTSREISRLVPAPARRALTNAWAPARSAAQLAALKASIRYRLGPGFVYTVDDRDEMLQFMREFWKWPYHVAPMKAPSDAMHAYLKSGDHMLSALTTVLEYQRRDLASVRSFLEFASGFGRFTRFLIMRLGRERVTVSDIDRAATDFAREAFGVAGFYSSESAQDVVLPGSYEVVFVASLFSHLSIEHWSPWLQRLYEVVEPGGVLIFSAHGQYARDVIFGERQRQRIESPAEGFYYLRSNETHGRLDVGYYGSTFVNPSFVESEVRRLGLGTLRRVYPAMLWGSQDLYVLEKPAPQA